MSTSQFFQTHLDRVSRSFAFCVAELEAPLREWVGLSYLLCRLLDTIEDSAWEFRDKKLQHFKEFQEFLQAPAADEAILAWIAGFPCDLVEGERLLVQDSRLLFSSLHALPSAPRGIISRTADSMARGMIHFARRESDGSVGIESLEELNQYCFFVAGIVGELLTELFAEFEPSFPRSGPELEAIIHDSHHFGLFLQKINILKDQLTDETQGRRFIPSREAVLQSLSLHAGHASNYLRAIPLHQRPFRLFCAWSLFLGLGSLPWIQMGWKDGQSLKLPRSVAQELIQNLREIIDDPEKLDALLNEFLESLPEAAQTSPASASEGSAHSEAKLQEWFPQSYLRPISQSSLERLGLIPCSSVST